MAKKDKVLLTAEDYEKAASEYHKVAGALKSGRLRVSDSKYLDEINRLEEELSQEKKLRQVAEEEIARLKKLLAHQQKPKNSRNGS